MTTVPSVQQHLYEQAYRAASNDFGMPDRKIIAEESALGKRILTLGGGDARDLWFVAQRATVINADYAQSGLQQGKSRGVLGVNLDFNLHATLPFAENSFDVVVCKDILEHVLSPLEILQEAARILKPDGKIIISVPNHFYFPMRLRLLLGRGILWRTTLCEHASRFHEWDYMHVRFFTYRGFREFLAAGGLLAEKFYWDFGTLAHYHDPERWFEPQLHKRKRGEALSARSRFALAVLRPGWRLFNLLFPRKLRTWMVSLAPGLLCAGFYARCRKA